MKYALALATVLVFSATAQAKSEKVALCGMTTTSDRVEKLDGASFNAQVADWALIASNVKGCFNDEGKTVVLMWGGAIGPVPFAVVGN